jgi:hypothetical protein
MIFSENFVSVEIFSLEVKMGLKTKGCLPNRSVLLCGFPLSGNDFDTKENATMRLEWKTVLTYFTSLEQREGVSGDVGGVYIKSVS